MKIHIAGVVRRARRERLARRYDLMADKAAERAVFWANQAAGFALFDLEGSFQEAKHKHQEHVEAERVARVRAEGIRSGK